MTGNSASTRHLQYAHIRVARSTDQLDEVVAFYSRVLGFRVLGRFKDHEGFDGAMLGHEGAGYHLEFTSKAGHTAGRAPTEDNLLVFYIPDIQQWRETTSHIETSGCVPVQSFNPYWDRCGRTYEDPDGYRIVIQNASWPGGGNP